MSLYICTCFILKYIYLLETMELYIFYFSCGQQYSNFPLLQGVQAREEAVITMRLNYTGEDQNSQESR